VASRTFLEGLARPLLIFHAVGAATLVAASTHHFLWCRHYLAGRFARVQAERRFALIVSLAFLANFSVGATLYPTYKVRVRAEYLDSQAAVADEARLRQAARLGPPDPATLVGASLMPVARSFDIKEHWMALTLAASLALLWLSRRAHPQDEPRIAPLYVGLSALICLSVWSGAVIGLYVTMVRPVG